MIVSANNVDKDIFKTRLVDSPFLNKQTIFIFLNRQENLRYFDLSVPNNEIQITIDSIDQHHLVTAPSHFLYKGYHIIYTLLVVPSIV